MADHCATPEKCPTSRDLQHEKERRVALERMHEDTLKLITASHEIQIETNTKLDAVAQTFHSYKAEVDEDIKTLYSRDNAIKDELAKKLTASDIIKYASFMLIILASIGGLTTFILKLTGVLK